MRSGRRACRARASMLDASGRAAASIALRGRARYTRCCSTAHSPHAKLLSPSSEPERQTMSHLLDASAKGVYAISATPFTDAGDIDWTSVDSLVEFYLQCGVQGLTILGMMGEAQKLSDEESAEFTRHYLRRVDGRVPVIVGVSNPGTANLVKLSKIAMDAGACGVMVAPLTGLKTEAQIVSYFGDVIAALGDNIPVVYQDYPQSTQADISAQSFLKIVDAHPSVVMFKHEDCPGLKKLSQMRDGLRWHRATLHQHPGRQRRTVRAAGAGIAAPTAVMTGFAYPEMLVSRVRAVRRRGAARRPKTCSTSICRWCATSSNPALGLRCARRSCAGAALSGRLRCARRARSSTPTTSRSSTGCWPASRRV